MSPFLGLRISNKGTKKLRIIYTGWSKLHLLLSRQHRTCCKTAKPIFQAAFRMRGLYLLFPVIAHKINAALVTSFGRTQKASKPSRFTTKSPDQHHLRLNLSAPWNSRKVEEVYTVGKWRQLSTGTKHDQTVYGTLCSAKLWSGMIRPTHFHNEGGSHWNNRKQNWMHLNANQCCTKSFMCLNWFCDLAGQQKQEEHGRAKHKMETQRGPGWL